jgi:hypothetical protein
MLKSGITPASPELRLLLAVIPIMGCRHLQAANILIMVYRNLRGLLVMIYQNLPA